MSLILNGFQIGLRLLYNFETILVLFFVLSTQSF